MDIDKSLADGFDIADGMEALGQCVIETEAGCGLAFVLARGSNEDARCDGVHAGKLTEYCTALGENLNPEALSGLKNFTEPCKGSRPKFFATAVVGLLRIGAELE